MATLIIKPFDPKVSGSFKQRSALFEAFSQMGLAKKSNSVSDYASAQLAFQRAVIVRLSTDDGTPVEDVLQQLSADEFDDLANKALWEAKEPAVPPENGAP